MNNQIIIQNKDLTPEPPATDLVGVSDVTNFNELKQELAQALKNKWMNMTFIAWKLEYIIEKAYQLNNKWDESPDFKTMLEATKTLLKIYWFDLSNTKTQIAVFNNIPAKWEKLNF